MSGHSKAKKTLIVTADDVGFHRGMTLGALAAHQGGIVTACSIVASGRDFSHAVERLRDHPALAVGVHLQLVEGMPLCEPRRIASLVSKSGQFLPHSSVFLRRYLAGGIALDEVERELRQQIETVAATGLEVRHLNGHQHLHALPRVYELVLRLAAEYGASFVRTPIDRQPRRTPLVRSLAVSGLALCARWARRRSVPPGGVSLGNATLGIAFAGHLSVERIAELLPRTTGLSELVCHPGVDDRAIAREFDWGYEWQRETDALCDPRVRDSLAVAGIDLISPVALARRA